MSSRVGRERALTLVCAGGEAPDLSPLPTIRAIWTADTAEAVEAATALRDRLRGTPSLHRTQALRDCLPGRPVAPLPQARPFEDLVFEAGAHHADTAFARFFIPARLCDKHEVLVTGPGLLAGLVCRVLGVDPLAWTNLDIDPGSVTRVRVHSDGRLRLLCLNARPSGIPADIPF